MQRKNVPLHRSPNTKRQNHNSWHIEQIFEKVLVKSLLETYIQTHVHIYFYTHRRRGGRKLEFMWQVFLNCVCFISHTFLPQFRFIPSLSPPIQHHSEQTGCCFMDFLFTPTIYIVICTRTYFLRAYLCSGWQLKYIHNIHTLTGCMCSRRRLAFAQGNEQYYLMC